MDFGLAAGYTCFHVQLHAPKDIRTIYKRHVLLIPRNIRAEYPPRAFFATIFPESRSFAPERSSFTAGKSRLLNIPFKSQK